jgi:hypothetical protein
MSANVSRPTSSVFQTIEKTYLTNPVKIRRKNVVRQVRESGQPFLAQYSISKDVKTKKMNV